MWFTLVFLLGTLFERFLNVEIGPLRLGPGDIVVLLSLPYCMLKYRFIKTYFLQLAGFTFLVILISILFNSFNYGFNSLITVPLRVVAAGVIANELLSLNRHSAWAMFFSLIYFLTIVMAVFFSDGSSLSFYELFNRNELLCYSVVFVILALFCAANSKTGISTLKFQHISILVLLLGAALMLQSRQNVMAILVAFGCVFWVLPLKKKMLVLIFLAGSIVVSAPLIMKLVGSNERLNARVSTVVDLEPATRADKYRLNNIIQAVEGFERSPIYGNGPTSFRRDNVYNKVAHSTPFSVIYELGLLGLGCLLLVFYKILRASFKLLVSSRSSPYFALLASLLPVVVVQSFFIELLPKAPLYVYLAIAVVVMLKLESMEKYSIHDKGCSR